MTLNRSIERRSGGVAAAILALLLAAAPPLAGAALGGSLSPELSERVRQAGADDLVGVIIQTRGEPSDAHMARMHGRGGVLKVRHEAIRGYSAKIPAAQIAPLADDPEIERISLDVPVRAHLDVAYKAVRADAAFAYGGGYTGRGVGVAVVDTGVVSHADLQRPKGSPQVVEVEIVGRESGLMDYFGHGTHVAGIINGNGASSSDRSSFRTFRGLAPGAHLVSLRALQPDGSGWTSDIIAAIDWAIRYRTSYAIRVLNLSLGHPVYESYTTDPLCRAARAAHDAGIVVVVAAGNDGAVGSGFGTITSPGNEPSAITVGATDDGNTVTTTDDVLAWYSSKGPSLVDYVVKPDLVAPGTWVVSLRAAGSYLDTAYHQFALRIGDYKTDARNAANDGAYYSLAGTSMAAPMVAGTAALMLQKEPGLRPACVKARLMTAAVKDERLMFETGAGTLDVEAALGQTACADTSPSPLALAADDGYVYVQDTAILWGGGMTSDVVWGPAKGKSVGFMLSNASESILEAYGFIWSRKCGPAAMLENNQITSSGLVWSGEASSLANATGTVDILAAVWGPCRKCQ